MNIFTEKEKKTGLKPGNPKGKPVRSSIFKNVCDTIIRIIPSRLREYFCAITWQSLLVTVVGVIGLYLLLMPILPQLWYYVKQLTGNVSYNEQGGEFVSSSPESIPEQGDTLNIPDENMLYVPSIGISVQIVEGDTDEALNRGAWRRPLTSTPDNGGNTVITGHRFKYLPPSNLTFYHLDKVQIGDEIVVYWNKLRYDYTVTRIFEVDPSQVEVEANTAQPQLTLYTCTPLWTAKRRLVVVAEPAASEDGADSGAENGAGDEGVPLEQIEE